jgi:hypothetical protein
MSYLGLIDINVGRVGLRKSHTYKNLWMLCRFFYRLCKGSVGFIKVVYENPLSTQPTVQ